MSNWDDALGRMQPHIEGAPRAGAPGMGAGPVPYAPGATTYQPNTAPPQMHRAGSAPDLPVNAGGRPAEGGGGGGYQPQGQGQEIDPMTSVRYMQMIYDWFMNGRSKVRQG